MQLVTYIIALRLFHKDHVRPAIESRDAEGQLRGRLIDTDVDRFYPVLKNIIAYLSREGILKSTQRGQVLRKEEDGSLVVDREADCSLYWCEVETSMPLSFWESRHEVEVIFEKNALTDYAASIRSRQGVQYIEACEEFARTLEVLPVRVSYAPPRLSRLNAA